MIALYKLTYRLIPQPYRALIWYALDCPPTGTWRAPKRYP